MKPALLLTSTLALVGPLGAQEGLLAELQQLLPFEDRSAVDLVATDLDGDGSTDVFVVHEPIVVFPFPATTEPPLALLNDGWGTFRAVPVSLTAGRTTAVAAADVDGDGDTDLVVAYEEALDRLLLNDGGGLLAESPGALPPLEENSQDVALGDVDGDGDADAILAVAGPAPNRLLANDGAGHFVDASTQLDPALSGGACLAVHLADVNGDGALDVLVGTVLDQQDRLYLNDGAGSFTDATATNLPSHLVSTTEQVTADVDSDGDLDLFGAGESSYLYENDGSGVFTDATGRLGGASLALFHTAVGDVDGDGDEDLVNVAWGGFELLRNDGSGTFTPEPEAFAFSYVGNFPARPVALADLDQDDDLDVYFGLTSQHLDTELTQDLVYFNDGGGTFWAGPANFPDVVYPDLLVPGDVDGDGHVDLVVRDAHQEGRVHLGDGQGVFSTLPAVLDLTSVRDAELADLDGDGDADLVLPGRTLENDGSGVFADPGGPSPTTASRLDVGDVDLDGDLDVAMVRLSSATDATTVFVNDGTGGLTESVGAVPQLSVDAIGVELSDLDGDGDLDYLLPARDSVFFPVSPTVLFTNDGAGQFELKSDAFDADYYSPEVAIGDADGDGDRDLLFSLYPDTAVLLSNDGTGAFTQTEVSTGVGGRPLAGDLDGDGALDFALGDPPGLLLGDGAGGLEMVPLGPQAAWEVGIAADIDGDGDLDVVGGRGRVDVFSNRTRELARRGLTRIGKPYELESYGDPGALHAVLWSAGTFELPIFPYGDLLLDPTGLKIAGGGLLDGDGFSALHLDGPMSSSFVGATIHWQALIGDPIRFTSRLSTTFTGF